MNPLRALLVDDERLARVRLRSLLQRHRQQVVVVDEADGVESAITVLKTHQPDVVFLDIQMPGGDGFQLFDKAEVSAQVVFVTAFDVHALRAFEVNALDYLMKPVAPARLAACIERLRITHERSSLPHPTPQEQLLGSDRVRLELGGSQRFVSVAALRCITAAGDYTNVHLGDGTTLLVSATLKEWIGRLPPTDFMRVHRSTIVHLHHVSALTRIGGTLNARIHGVSQPVAVSRRHVAALRARLQ